MKLKKESIVDQLPPFLFYFPDNNVSKVKSA